MHSERSAPGGGLSSPFDWRDWRKGENLFFAAIILLSLFRLLHQVLKFLKESPFIDLASYYLHWTMARAGLDLFDPKAIEAASAAFPHRAAGGPAVNVPSVYVLFQPLSLVPYSVFPALWMVGSLGFMFLGTLIFLREERDRISWASFTFVVLIAAMYQPLYEDLVLGQMNTPVFFCGAWAWRELRRGRPWMAGIPIAVMAMLKIPFVFLIGFALLLGNFRWFAASAGGFAVLFLAGLPQLGAAHYANYFGGVFFQAFDYSLKSHDISLYAQWRHFLGGDLSAVFHALNLALFGSVFWLLLRKKFPPRRQFLIGLALVPVLSPHTTEHHLVPTLLPFFCAALWVVRAGAATKAMYLASAVLVVSHYSWVRFLGPSPAILDLLVSLKILGVLLLLAVLFRAPAAEEEAEEIAAG